MFMLASIIVPIIANGIRAWGTIYIAQSQGLEFAAGFDHIFYGWIFFAIVVAVLIGGAWRYFERDSEDFGWTADEVAQLKWLDAAEARTAMRPIVCIAAMASLMVFAFMLTTIVGPVALG